MTPVNLKGRETEPGVVKLFAEAQIHREPADALARAPAIALEYARSDRLLLWGCEIDGSVVAIAGVEPRPGGELELHDLAVAVEYRRRGIGRRLVAFLQAWASVTGIHGDTLETVSGFYEACGFTVVAADSLPGGTTTYRFRWPG